MVYNSYLLYPNWKIVIFCSYSSDEIKSQSNRLLSLLRTWFIHLLIITDITGYETTQLPYLISLVFFLITRVPFIQRWRFSLPTPTFPFCSFHSFLLSNMHVVLFAFWSSHLESMLAFSKGSRIVGRFLSLSRSKF